ncbi:alternative ribosome rescue aminoacyl-tRNA hydrolase ArfB [Croceivirga thetidis]|uniref:Aminoacyl-tRNA hydrolase n=1 Tax=Croceivirga thetidis TaxID=2721623 RepID=A0ABX1GN69_9FLAO|nr:alternative ribosome rescue aminoacyl-tRNA hydrolase ArfB [Croceivirga thetidis]NKI31329.1 aminoacyl-tRNA hydrolase [Croceivirga thetidis]
MDKAKITNELQYRAVRSGGPGGQHANKVSSKVQLSFHPEHSEGLSDFEKNLLVNKLSNHISNEGWLQLSSETSRSQHKNKELVTKRFFKLLEKALQLPKKRKTTKPSKSVIEKRLKSKKMNSEKKSNRKKPLFD